LLKDIVVLLLLLQGRATTSGTRWRANAQRVLTIRQANAATLDKAVQRVAIKVIERSRGKANIFELDETHRAIAFVAEAQLAVSRASLEHLAEAIFQIVRWIARWNLRGRQIPNI